MDLPEPTRRFLFTVQYLGTNYAGWQTQTNAVGVQQVIEGSLERMFGMSIRIEGSGRTDAGVHALAQRAHADLPTSIGPHGLVLGLNDLLPSDIRISSADIVPHDFHARFDACGKTYRYRIWNTPAADVFRAATHAHVRQPLDSAAMQDAAAPLLGHHDFRSFTVAVPSVSSTWRTIEDITVERYGRVILITVSADGFLRFMVRRIVGSLIEAGRGGTDAKAVAACLEPDYGVARWTAPAAGLTLLSVRYDRLKNGELRMDNSE